MSDIDPKLLEAARQIVSLTDGREIARVTATEYARIGDDAISLLNLYQPPVTIADVARAGRDLRNDPHVGPMLDRMKAALLVVNEDEAAVVDARKFSVARLALAVKIAEQLGLSAKAVDKIKAQLGELEREGHV